jgi:hypothetical protein
MERTCMNFFQIFFLTLLVHVHGMCTGVHVHRIRSQEAMVPNNSLDHLHMRI